jgi:hypothetical protein
MELEKTDKVTLAGLYLSKFDKKALDALGFKGMCNAFNIMGYALGAKPASIKNYRDEFDSLFPANPRKGWQRPLKVRSQKLFMEFRGLDFQSFTDLIKSFLIQNYEIEKFIEKMEGKDASASVAKRLTTGRSAEEYFRINYQAINQFKEHELSDTTNLACGFDFKLSQRANFYCVEVKGLNLNNGSILMTEKEFFVANELKQKYCLFVVLNFAKKPYHECFFDPLNSRLTFKKTERKVAQINYSTSI